MDPWQRLDIDWLEEPRWISHHLYTGPKPAVAIEPAAEHGPVMVTVEYRIDRIHAGDFVLAMQEVRLERLRDGALRWELFHDPADPSRYVETFLVESWVEHLRQHERVTLADREAEVRARALHRAPTPVAVSHLIAVRVTAAKTVWEKA
jgi:Transmembrane secretion effector